MKRCMAMVMIAFLLTVALGCGKQHSDTQHTTTGTITTGNVTTGVPTLPGTTATLPTIGMTDPATIPTTLPTMPTTVATIPATTFPTTPTTTSPIAPTTLPAETVLPDVPTQVKEELQPGSLWIVNANEYVSMRRDAIVTATRIAKVPRGSLVTLRGWNGKFAYVEFDGKKGFVMSSYIQPADESYMAQAVDTIGITGMYTYEMMMEDLVKLVQAHPDVLEMEIIGRSELGRDIPVVRMGDPNAAYHVMIQSAIHGREHMTAWLTMAMVDYWSERDVGRYGDVCWHFIPMVNPDGVTISQTKVMTPQLREIYENDLKYGYTTLDPEDYLENWKANGLGVDLNRNFPAGWEYLTTNTEGPSFMNYQGTEVFCAAESIMLREYTLAYDFDVTISYHATGSVIFYEYGDRQPTNRQSYSLGLLVRSFTYYDLYGSTTSGAAGYKDWAIDTMGIPSLTIEVGTEDTPLGERELYNIFVRNCPLLPKLAEWMQNNL